MKNSRVGWMAATVAAVVAVAAAFAVMRKPMDPDATAVTQSAVAGDVADTQVAVAAETNDGTGASDVDLSGTWRFDPTRSDMPRWGDRGGARGARPDGPRMSGRRGGFDGGARRSGPGRDGDGGRRGRFGGRMPSLMEIRQDGGAVMLADSTGEPFAEIRTDGTAPEAAMPAPHEDGPRVMAGTWQGTALAVSRPGPGGAAITQRFSLEDDGQTLVIHHQQPAGGERPAREFKRVYRRVAGS